MNKRYSIEHLPPLTKETILNHYPKRANDRLWIKSPAITRDEWRRSFTMDEWHRIVEGFNLLNDEIEKELAPYILGSPDEYVD